MGLTMLILPIFALGIESGLRMELILNLAWILLAALALGQWMRFGAQGNCKPRVQCIALALLILILFPVVSVTDDLQAALNPAETDCFSRRDDGFLAPHPVVPVLADLPESAINGHAFGIARTSVAGGYITPLFERPALAPIESRPPPAA
jgi:hypothetical protein